MTMVQMHTVPESLRTLEDKVTDLEVQIAESLLSGSYHASRRFGCN